MEQERQQPRHVTVEYQAWHVPSISITLNGSRDSFLLSFSLQLSILVHRAMPILQSSLRRSLCIRPVTGTGTSLWVLQRIY